jgi:hypothetical protein
VRTAFEQDSVTPGTTWTMTRTWSELNGAATLVADTVRPRWIDEAWAGRPRPTRELAIAGFADAVARLAPGPVAGPAVPAAEPEGPWFAHAEEFIALRLLLSVRNVLARLVNGLGVIAAGNLLALASYSFYPFQPAQLFLAVGWANMIAAAVVIVYVLAQIERNEVLSNVTHTKPGEVNFNSTFVFRLLLFGALPLATMFATQFPSIGGMIVQWLEPVQKALP